MTQNWTEAISEISIEDQHDTEKNEPLGSKSNKSQRNSSSSNLDQYIRHASKKKTLNSLLGKRARPF